MDGVAVRSSSLLLGWRSGCATLLRAGLVGLEGRHQWRVRTDPPPLSTWQTEPEHPDCVQQYLCPVRVCCAMAEA